MRKVSDRDQRYYCLAISMKDAVLCEDISDKDKQNYCIGIAGGNTTACDRIGSESYESKALKDDCYMQIIAELKDPAVCETKEFSEYRKRCESALSGN